MPDKRYRSDKKYWFINSAAGLLGGAIAGYCLEKNGMPVSLLDVGLWTSAPPVIGGLEYVTKRYILGQNNVDDRIISASSVLGIGFFMAGDEIGRYLARIF